MMDGWMRGKDKQGMRIVARSLYAEQGDPPEKAGRTCGQMSVLRSIGHPLVGFHRFTLVAPCRSTSPQSCIVHPFTVPGIRSNRGTEYSETSYTLPLTLRPSPRCTSNHRQQTSSLNS